MMQNPPAADRVLIIRLGAMGDVIRTLPAVAALRVAYPGAHLTWLVEPAAAGVIECSGLVDEVLEFPRRRLMEAIGEGDPLEFLRRLRSFVGRLRERRFEVAIDFHGILKSGVLARLSGAAIRFGFAAPSSKEGAVLFANRRIAGVPPASSRFDRNAALARAVAPGVVVPEGPLLAPSALARARLVARLRAAGRERSRDFVLIHPGSSAGALHKRYSAEGWAAVARALGDAGLEVWITCGPNRYERNLAEDIVRRAGDAVVLAPDTRSFDDLLALQARAAVFVACDSGPLHAASLAGVPVVQLLGPTHPDQNAPFRGTPARIIRVPLTCSPCRKGCADPACMRAIPPQVVADTTRALLESVVVPTSRDVRSHEGSSPDASHEPIG